MFARILASLAFVLVSLSATPVAAQGNPFCTHHYGGGQTCWGPGSTGPLNQGGQLSYQGQNVYYGGNPVYVLPYGAYSNGHFGGHSLSNCQFFGGLAGGAIGHLNRAHRGEATILGAILGGFAADRFLCSNNQGQQVLVLRAPQTQAAAVIPATPVQSGLVVHSTGGTRHTCSVGEYVIDVAPTQDCRNLDAAVRSVGGRTLNQPNTPTPGTVGQQAGAPQQGSAQDPPKPWGHIHHGGQCFITHEATGQKPAACVTMKVVPAKEGESQMAWKDRAPSAN